MSRIRDPELLMTLSGVSLVCFSETYLRPGQSVSLPGFQLLEAKIKPRRTSVARYPGGLALFQALTCPFNFTVLDVGSNDVIWVSGLVLSHVYFIGFVYNHPLSSPYHDRDFFDLLANNIYSLTIGVDSSRVILMGDFNARTASESEFPADCRDRMPGLFVPFTLTDFSRRNSQDPILSAMGRQFLGFCRETGLRIMNGREPADAEGRLTYISHNGNSVIDYALVSDELFRSCSPAFGVLDSMVTEHSPIFLKICFSGCSEPRSPSPLILEQTAAIPSRLVFPRVMCPSKVLHLESDVWSIFPLFELGCEGLFHSKNVEDISVGLVQTLRLLGEPVSVKNKRIRLVNPLGFDNKCRRICKEGRIALRAFRKTNAPRFRRILCSLKRRYRVARCAAYKQNRLKLESDLRAAVRMRNAETIWRIIKRSSSSESFVKCSIKSEKWIQHFNQTLNYNTLKKPEWQVDVDALPDVPALDDPITEEEILEALRKIKSGRAPGRDGITGGVLKTFLAFNSILKFFVRFFNLVLESGVFPSGWSNALIFTLYKGSGNRNDPDKYRGIALLSHIGKLFSRVLAARMRRWSEDSKLSPFQAGFRSGRCTVDQAFILDTIVKEHLNKKRGKVYACFVDFRKAFDYVSRQGLLYCLVQKGISKKIYTLLASMFASSSFAIKIDQTTSSRNVISSSGVFQGCTWSPLLFILFIDTIFDFLETIDSNSPIILGRTVRALMFADDLVLLSLSVAGLQRLLEALFEFSKYWGLEVNLAKSFVVAFKRGGKLSKTEEWTYNLHPLTVVKKVSYLGFMFSSSSVWTNHRLFTAQNASRSLFTLLKVFHKFPNLSAKFFLALYTTAVEPIVLYGSEIFGAYPDGTNILERPMLKFIKRILGLPIGAPSAALRLDLALIQHKEKAIYRAISYWCKCTRLQPTHPAAECLQHQLYLISRGVRCWAAFIKDHLFRLGFGYIWEGFGPADLSGFKKGLLQRIRDISFSDAMGVAQALPSLSYYTQIKSQVLGPEPYTNNSKIIRRCFAILRFNLKRSLPCDQSCTYCLFCNEVYSQDIWSHFLYNCPNLKPLHPSTPKIPYPYILRPLLRGKYPSIISRMSDALGKSPVISE